MFQRTDGTYTIYDGDIRPRYTNLPELAAQAILFELTREGNDVPVPQVPVENDRARDEGGDPIAAPAPEVQE